MEPIKPRDVEREVRTILSAADRNTLSAAGLTVVQRVPLEMLLVQLENIADITARYPKTRMAASLRPQVYHALYLIGLLLEGTK